MKKRLFKTMLFFLSVSALMCIMIFSASAKTVSYGNFKFDVSSKKATLIEYTGKAENVKIPSKISGVYVTAIGTEAFWSNKTMKTVSIPTTVTSIGIAAFNECSSLTKVVIPYKVKAIGESAFWYCTNLKSVVIPKATASIGKNAFKGCSSLTAYVTKGSYAESYIKKQSDIKLGYRYMSSMSLGSSSLKVGLGSTVKLTVTASPSVVYYKKFTFSSSNKKVATVDAYGRIKGIACGSATITVKSADGSKLTKQCKVTVVPAEITKLTASNVTATGFTISWKAVKGATHYKLYTYNSTTKKWNSLLITTKLSYTVKNLSSGETRYYKIMPYAKIGKSNYCGKISKTFKFKSAVPEAVTNLTATVAGTDKVNLKWQKAAYATGYRVYLYDLSAKKYIYQFSTKNLSAQFSGLFSGTKYGFVIRSYTTSNGKIVLGKANSNIAYCTTRPAYVTNLAVDESSVTLNSLTLKWDSVKGVTGYRVSMWDETKNAYVTLKNIYGEENTSFTAENLEPGKEYKFTVRTFLKNSTLLLFGYNCSAVTATTEKAPATQEDIFNTFVTAYNATKAATDITALMVMHGTADDVSAPERNYYEPVISSVFETGGKTLYFENGADKASGKTLNSLLTPSDALLTLSFNQIDADSVEYMPDGSGNRIRFTLKSEDSSAAINSLIAPTVDWEKIAAENTDFTLNSCTYQGTVVDAKINEKGLIDDISFSVPVSVSFNLGENAYSFSGTATHDYMFVWFTENQ